MEVKSLKGKSVFVKYKYITNMELRVVEIARSKGLTMADIAKQVGISRVNLSNSLNGNPTLTRLTEVAKILGVEVSELFKTTTTNNYVITTVYLCFSTFFSNHFRIPYFRLQYRFRELRKQYLRPHFLHKLSYLVIQFRKVLRV